MFRIFAHTFLILVSFSVSAQKLFGHEWIHVGKTYIKIPVTENGFYKITGKELDLAGLSVNEIPPGAVQMFRRGKELAISVNAESPEKLGVGGAIIFYGEKNDGSADSALYVAPAAMPDGHYSLYTDTAAYFLTWRTDGGFGKRIKQAAPGSPSKNIDYHFAEAFQLFNSHYLPGAFYPAGSNFETGSVLSDYDVGEGWSGPEIAENQTFEISFKTKNALREHFGEAEIELRLTGWTSGDHAFELWSGNISNLKRKLAAVAVRDYQSQKLKISINPEDLADVGDVTITLVPVGKGGHASVSYALLRYPQKIILQDFSIQKTFRFPASDHLQWRVDKNANVAFFDITNPFNPQNLNKSDVGIPLNRTAKVLGVKQFLHVNKMHLIKFRDIHPADFNYLIVSHALMHLPVDGIDPVTSYATYRASPAGGSYRPFVINISEIYDQFNYGDPGPAGLRNLIFWLHETDSLRFVFLIGKSIDPQKVRKLADPGNVDMIPNAGWPGSDIALTMYPGTKPDSVGGYPVVPIGRLNALTSRNVFDYLQKVKALEAEPANASWRQNILHLSGGRSRDELAEFKSYVKDFEQKLAGSNLAPNILTISKQTDDPVEELPIQEHLNKGAALMTLFGHSGIDVTDIDIGYASDPKRKYHIHPKYPAVIVNGCASGSMFYSDKSLSTNWILTPKNGAVLFLAHTFNGASTALKKYTETFYEVLADSAFTHQAFGNIQTEAIKRNFSHNPDIYDRITAQQMNLHGDPAIRIFPGKFSKEDIDSTLITEGFGHLNVSPNPSNSYFQFKLEANSQSQASAAQFYIYNSTGTEILHQTQAILPGSNVWYWYPGGLPAGLYIYRIVPEESHLSTFSESQAALQGRLLWVR